jgi:general secretion pathway protein A
MLIDLSFYGLREQPFNPTPDPRFLYLTPAHQEALAQLMYGVQEQRGFILLTGEVGTGKTTLVQSLLEQLDAATAVAVITNPMLGFESLLEYILEDLGIAKSGESHAQRIFALQNFLIERRRAGQNTVVILDEAHDLDPQTLERIRLLSNFETTTEKLLQILLVGQPELWAKLDTPQLRQLTQRIGLRCQIPALTPGQVRDYIVTRLQVAGARDPDVFSPGAIMRIARYSQGIPRLINTLCEHCLVLGYADQVRRIDREIVEEAIQYLEAGRRSRRRRSAFRRRRLMTPLRWSVLGLSAAAAAMAGLTILHPELLARAIELAMFSLADLARSTSVLLGR